MSKIILFNKPFGVLSQFTDEDGRHTLADYIDQPGFYAAGRLDFDSEGLMLLTDDGQLQHQISHPRQKLPKTYWVQVEGEISDAALAELRRGVQLKDGITAPARARRLSEPAVWPRQPPVRQRQSIPTSWLELTIREGRNRQVRRMTAAVGFPTLRLIRKAIGSWQLGELGPGQQAMTEVFAAPSNRPSKRTPDRSSQGTSRRPGGRPRRQR